MAIAERLDCETPDMRAYLDRVCPSKQVSETHQLLICTSHPPSLPLSLSLLSFYVRMYLLQMQSHVENKVAYLYTCYGFVVE